MCADAPECSSLTSYIMKCESEYCTLMNDRHAAASFSSQWAACLFKQNILTSSSGAVSGERQKEAWAVHAHEGAC